MTKRTLLLLVLLLAPSLAWASNCDGAGNCYIRAGATGSGSGSNWTNACTGFTGACAPTNMTRGVVYWVAAGSYGDVTFNTADSGTQVITIRGTTTANHGPASDWNNAFAGQALFKGNGSDISTDYWTFDGRTRGADWQSDYTIKFQLNNTAANLRSSVISFTTKVHDITFKYVELMGTASGNMSSTADGDNALAGSNPSNLYIGYSYLHETGNVQFQLNNCSTGCGTGHTYEYNYVYKNHTCCDASHDEAFSLTASNVIIRYNKFVDIVSTGIITDAAAFNNDITNWDIYGNLFYWDEPFATSGGPISRPYLTDGVIAFLGENMSGTLNVYNNTIANFHANSAHPCGYGDVSAAIFGHQPGGAVNINVENNLTWNSCNQKMPLGPNNPPPSFTGTLTWDYQTYSGGDNNRDDTSAHKRVIAGNPFVNAPVYNFRLSAPMTGPLAGTSLSSPYNRDMDGNTRGANGAPWDRGAYQFVVSAARPDPPQNLTITIR